MPVDAVSAGSGSAGYASAATEALDKNQFLNLLITQIRHQDPLSPMDNQQFISQLTQFSTLEEMQRISGKLDDGMSLSQSLNNTMLLGLVGRKATVMGQSAQVRDGAVGGNQIQAGGAGTATIVVRDAAGNQVATYSRAVKYGMNDIAWDGRNADGGLVADGLYKLEIEVEDAGGKAIPFASFMTGYVDGIRYEGGLAVVEVCGERFSVGDVFEVKL